MLILPKVEGYKSPQQRIKNMTEWWAGEHIYSPCCGMPIIHHINNTPASDFYCQNCQENYELKAWKTEKFSNTVLDGWYKTMVEKVESSTNPNYFVLQYNKQFHILNYIAIPKYFVRKEDIIPRKNWLRTRPNYIMCSISMRGIPESWKIYLIKDGSFLDKKEILRTWEKTVFLWENKDIEAKGWILDIMKCIDTLWKQEFTLDEMYAFEPILKQKYQNNNFIKDKMRQQLQVLRDKGYVEFKERGKYRVL